MHRTHISLMLAITLLVSLAMSGCFSRRLVSFQTHPEKDVLLMETVDHHDYWLLSDHEHVYWSCTEEGTNLRCQRRCGGSTELACPQTSYFQSSAGTNIR